ncbi:hypothetical protein L227DRAFT_359827 [Lentinus tigrinus ALCF2SS1-6]|uniref:Uncharacterized protein n=1 Tax=Lentinus tigrinus ALCF2SS1-6 TaxID=1328759 RepID=A0A5C2SJ04_9APHY|nr:hypothetical protein L227DRAFT_359827 [Lentinus tigrinus ALCF2SS1-6]
MVRTWQEMEAHCCMQRPRGPRRRHDQRSRRPRRGSIPAYPRTGAQISGARGRASRAPRGPCQLRPPIVRRIWVAQRPLFAVYGTRRVYFCSAGASFCVRVYVRGQGEQTEFMSAIRLVVGGFLFFAAATGSLGCEDVVPGRDAVQGRQRAGEKRRTWCALQWRRRRSEDFCTGGAVWPAQSRAYICNPESESGEKSCVPRRGCFGTEQERGSPYSLAARSGRKLWSPCVRNRYVVRGRTRVAPV